MSTNVNYPSILDPEAQRVAAVTREILGENYLHFGLERMEMVEDKDGVAVKVRLSRSGVGEHSDIDGKGVGLIDAFFEGLTRRFGDEYPSLKTIAVTDFRVGSGFDEAQGRRSDALAVATLRMKNSHGAEFQFERKTPSVTRSSVRVALDAVTIASCGVRPEARAEQVDVAAFLRLAQACARIGESAAARPGA